MATTTTARRGRKDPQGRMPLREHLRELRRRVVIAGIAVLLGAIVGWLVYKPIFNYLTAPIAAAEASGQKISINFGTVGAAFDLQLKMSIWIGVIITSPVWIYQLWAFITPGLTRKERRYALGFVGTAVPLFLAGVYLASFFIPNAFTFLTGFTPKDGSNIISADVYLGFVMRTVLAFGVAFLLPVVLVALNFAGLVSGRAILRAWRWVTVLVFTFAAIATPTPDVTSMFLLALPMLALFAIAIAICLLRDRRRAREEPDWDAELAAGAAGGADDATTA